MRVNSTLCYLAIVIAFLCPTITHSQTNVFTTSNGGFEAATTTLAANGWTDVSNNNSKWYVGNAAVASGSYGAYIDKNASAGSVNTYNNNQAFVSHFYKDFTIPAGAVTNLTFKWRCDGEAADNLRVYVIPNTTTPVAGTALSTGLVGGPYFGQGTSFQTVNMALTGVAGFTRRLVFTWTQNANNAGNNPPAAVDDVQISYSFPCTGTPTAGSITAGTSSFCGSGSTTLTLGGSTVAADITKQWQYYNGSSWINVGTGGLTYSTGTISSSTQYQVISTCTATGLSSTAGPITVTVNPSPVVSVSPADTFVCTSGGSMTLTASGTATSYTWSPGTNLNTTTGTTVISTPTTGRAYTVTGTLGPCSTSAMAIVSIGTGPTITTTATPATICSGNSTQLTTSQSSGEYEVYSIAPYTLTPSSPTIALSNPTNPPTNSNFDDGRTAAIALPFSFIFYGSSYSNIFMGTNGDVAFTQNNLPDYYPQFFPDPNTPNNVIALFWHDLDLTPTGTVSYGTTGIAPNRRFVITYSGIPVLGNSTPDNTGQIILHETTNYIDVIVQNSSVYDFKTLGIENSSGSSGVTPTGKNQDYWTVNTPEAYRFAIPSYTYAWSPTTNLSGTNIYNPVASGLTSSITYNVNVKNSITSCSSTGTAAVTVNPLPTASITAGISPICDGQTSTVTFTGTPNATVTYDINSGTPQTVILDNTGTATIPTPILNAAAVYHLQSVVSAQNCTTTLSGTATINVKLRPTATISGSTTICNGGSAFPFVTIGQGTIPYTVTYFDGTNTYTQTSSNTSFALTVSPGTTTTYILTGLTDANCAAVSSDISGSATVTVNPRPTASLATTATAICDGTTADLVVSMTGNAPYNFDIYDGSSYTSYTNIPTNTYNIPLSPTATTTYSITYLTDVNCIGQGTDLGNSASLIYNVRPTASLSGSNAICDGNSTPLTVYFTGNGPWNFSYNDGSSTIVVPNISANPYTFNLSPNTNTNYSLTAVSDVNCTAWPVDISGAANITVYDPPVILSHSGSVNTCTGDNAVFAVNATGTNLVYQWTENGIPIVNGGVYSGADGPTLVISDVTGLGGNVYQLQLSGTCPPTLTSTAVTLMESNHNQWTGTTNNLWSEKTNWSCGILPTVNTMVEITPAAPFQPKVDIPTAICKNLLIYSGASVEIIGTNNALEVKQDIVSLGQFDAHVGKLIVSGNGPQNIPGVIYKSLEVQGGSVKTFSGNAVVTSTLGLFSGYLQLGQNNLILGQHATVNGGSAGSFVVTNGSGKVVGENMGAGANLGTVLFPVGSNTTSYTPVMISNTGTADDINVRVIDGVWEDYSGNTGIGLPLTSDVVNKTWLIHETIPGGSNATITPQWNFAEHLTNFTPSNCAVSHYTGNNWEPGPLSAATGFSPYTQTLTGVTSFSPFGVSSAGPLGLQLLSFNGMLQDADAKLNWISTNEVNMAEYELQRSTDQGNSFSRIGSMKAIGNNKIGNNTYSYVDALVTSLDVEKVLYRLKMKDNTGKYAYSNIVAISIGKAEISSGIDLYPNPVTGSDLFVKMGDVKTEGLSVQITDMSGKVISTTNYASGSYNAEAVRVDVSQLSQGIYMLRILDANKNTIETRKFNRQQ